MSSNPDYLVREQALKITRRIGKIPALDGGLFDL